MLLLFMTQFILHPRDVNLTLYFCKRLKAEGFEPTKVGYFVFLYIQNGAKLYAVYM